MHSCRLDIGNEKGDTPLHIAARWGYQGIIEVLLQNGANPNTQNRMKETSLQCALNSKVLLFIFQLDFSLMQFHRSVAVNLLIRFCTLVLFKLKRMFAFEVKWLCFTSSSVNAISPYCRT